MHLVAGSAWRSVLALLIAVTTALLCTAPPRESWAAELGRGDDHLEAGHHDVPLVSRQQDRCESTARRDGQNQSPADTQLVGFELHVVSVFAAWSLPAAYAPSRSRHIGGWYARGPPQVA